MSSYCAGISSAARRCAITSSAARYSKANWIDALSAYHTRPFLFIAEGVLALLRDRTGQIPAADHSRPFSGCRAGVRCAYAVRHLYGQPSTGFRQGERPPALGIETRQRCGELGHWNYTCLRSGFTLTVMNRACVLIAGCACSPSSLNPLVYFITNLEHRYETTAARPHRHNSKANG